MRVRLDLAYDGSHYQGWQRQNTTKNTVQGKIEEALSNLFQENILVQASGRTDQGAHARHQVLHFDTSKEVSKYNLGYSLARFLPDSISALAAYQTSDEFHARYSVKAKEYRYYIYSRERRNPFYSPYALYLKRELDLERLNSYASKLLGRQDFASFQKSGSNIKITKREIFHASWRKYKAFYEFRIIGDGFLRQMVRNLVGCMLEAEKHGKNSQHIQSIIEAKDRSGSGVAVSPCGLYLHQVYYPPELDNKCLKL